MAVSAFLQTRLPIDDSTKITADAIRAMKVLGEKIVALTAYDFPMTSCSTRRPSR